MAVLITRPDESGTQLATMLNQVGIATINLPLFTITAGRELNELPNKINQLSSGDYVFCVSKNAVKYSTETLKAIGFHWRQDLHYFAVGQSTAEYFSSKGEIAVHYPFEQENSEGLLNLPAMQQLEGKQVLILRGDVGRELFPEQAQLRGATVHLLECYQRSPIVYNNEEQTDLCKRAGINKIIVTSAEILNSLIEFVPEMEQNWLKSCQLITISHRIAKLALKAGWQKENILISPKADNMTLVETLLTVN